MFYDRFKLLCQRKNISCTKAATEMGLSNSTPTKWKKQRQFRIVPPSPALLIILKFPLNM